MTSPSLPSFLTRSTRRVYTRTNQSIRRLPPKAQRNPSFLDRHGDRITFIWSCILIAALVYSAFS